MNRQNDDFELKHSPEETYAGDANKIKLKVASYTTILEVERAYLEEEKEMLKLYKKYPEEALETLFPQFALYYKLGKDKEAKELLEKINKANPHFIKFFNGTIKRNEDISYGYYSKGDSSEVIMYFEQYNFLVMTLPSIHEFVLENSKKSKN